MHIDDVLQRIQGEFTEMPGLRLTPAQAQRLWGLDPTMADTILSTLVSTGVLRKTARGGYIKSNAS